MYDKVFEPIKLFFVYSRYMTKAFFQYKFDAFLRTLAVFIRESTAVIVVYLTLQRFDNINGWNMKELLFLYSFIYITYSLLILFFTGLRDFEEIVYDGTFDRFLLRPRGLMFQVMTNYSDYLASIGHGTLGIILFINTSRAVGIVWNVTNVIYCILAIIGGVLIQASIFMLFSCASFYFIKIDSLKDFLYYNTRKIAGYPISIFPAFIRKMMIFIVPFAFVNYFPSQYFLNKKDMAEFWHGYIYLTPVIGIVLYTLTCGLWKISLRHYESTGN